MEYPNDEYAMINYHSILSSDTCSLIRNKRKNAVTKRDPVDTRNA